MIRLLAGLLVPVVLGTVAFGCDDSKPPAATRTALSIEETSAAFIQTPFPTSTPFQLDRSVLRPPPACPGCLVVADYDSTRAIDLKTGVSTIIGEIPAEASSPYNWHPSPDGSVWVFPCNAEGALDGDNGAARCLWGYGLSGMPIADPIERGAFLHARAASWSPDGRFLVMFGTTTGTPGSGGIVQETRAYIHDVRAGTTRNIGGRGSFQEFGEPSWSPDGNTLAISRSRNNVYSNVLVVDAATAFPWLITEDEKALVLSIGGIVWSPDNKQIAFVRDTVEPLTPLAGAARSFRHTIIIADADGSKIRELPDEYGLPLAWSPGGQWLLVERSSPPTEATGFVQRSLLFAVSTGGGGEHVLSEGFVIMNGGAFSPDGARVAFIGIGDPNDNTTRGVFIVSVEGGPAVKLAIPDLPYAPPVPTWTKDGGSIVFSGWGGCGKGGCSPGALLLVDVSGATPAVELLPFANRILGWLPE